MSGHSLTKSDPILLVGAGPTSSNMVTKAFLHAKSIVAVDGGLQAVQSAGLTADAVLGDFDSVTDTGDTPRISCPDQNLNDFEKALGVVDAPILLGVGFLGGRLDHHLASFSALLKDDRPIVLVDDEICCFIAPPSLMVNVPVGSNVAFYPLRPCRVDIAGVDWPVTDAAMAPDGLISTSNRMATDQLKVHTLGRGLLVILPAGVLPQVVSVLSLKP